MEILTTTYGKTQALKYFVMWRMFFLAVEEMFGIDNGESWLVDHYLFEAKQE